MRSNTSAASPEHATDSPSASEPVASRETGGSSVTTVSSVNTSSVAAATPTNGAKKYLANGVAQPVAAGQGKVSRDSSWLELEVCRDFQRNCCPRNSEECRFAHPQPPVLVKDGKVTCCYDFLKDRCQRDRCKYFHPSMHIKHRLVAAGKQFGAMMSNMYAVPGSSYPTSAPVSPYAVMPSPDGVMSPGPTSFVPAAVVTPYGTMTNRLYVCPEFTVGRCSVHLCPFVHPEHYVRRNVDATVTLCRDFINGGCMREQCRFFHPPPHIASQLNAATVAGHIPQSPNMFMPPSIMSGPVMFPFQPPPTPNLPPPPFSHPPPPPPPPHRPVFVPSSGMPLIPMVAPVYAVSLPQNVPMTMASSAPPNFFPMPTPVTLEETVSPNSPILLSKSVDMGSPHQAVIPLGQHLPQ